MTRKPIGRMSRSCNLRALAKFSKCIWGIITYSQVRFVNTDNLSKFLFCSANKLLDKLWSIQIQTDVEKFLVLTIKLNYFFSKDYTFLLILLMYQFNNLHSVLYNEIIICINEKFWTTIFENHVFFKGMFVNHVGVCTFLKIHDLEYVIRYDYVYCNATYREYTR